MTSARPRLRDADGHYQRPPLDRSAPDRRFRGYYRSAQGENGQGGRAPQSIEAAVVQAVRLAYRVADEQIDRSTRLAQRLKHSADAEAGPDADLQTLDAAERLGLKVLMSAVSWLQTAAAEPGSPLRQMATAQYRILGNLMGLSGAVAAPVAAAASATSAPHPPAATPPPDSDKQRRPLAIQYSGSSRRPIDQRWIQFSAPAVAGHYGGLALHRPGAYGQQPIPADLHIGRDGQCTLSLDPPDAAASGAWAAAVCTQDGLLLGLLQFNLL